jgi:preprotein translocase subunit SecY
MNKILQLFRVPELRNKILIVAGLILAFRILAVIPVPGIDAVQLSKVLGENQLLGFLNLFSGGSLSNLSIMMLGVGPYITGSIIMQLLTMMSSRMKQLYYEEGAMGRMKFNQYSRYLTVPLALVQGYAFLNLLARQGVLPELVGIQLIASLIVITAGSCILMWLGELMSEQKIGNGISLIIFAGIVSGLPRTVQNLLASYTDEMLVTYIIFALVSVLVIAGVVFISEGERKVAVTYAKQVRGNKMFGGITSYLPLKVNQAGVIPIIFAVSMMMFPQLIAQLISVFSVDLSVSLQGIVNSIFNNQGIYASVYFVLVVAFTYFYTSISFNPGELAKNLQQSGGFIPGIRPGEPTEHFLKSTSGRITFFGAIFLGVIAILPNLVQIFSGVRSFTIGGTALLIVVSVALEISRQVNSQLTIREYDSIN